MRRDGKKSAKSSRAFLCAWIGVLAGLAPTLGIAGEGPLLLACAERDLAVLNVIEEHRYAQDMAPERLAAAFMSLIHARQVCAGNARQGLALYDDISFELQLRSVLYRATVVGPMD